MSKSIFSFGEILWDVFPDATVLGGAPFNVAARLNMLGDKTKMISRIGRDDLGENVIQKVTELGMDTSFLQRDDKYPTGTVDITFDELKNPDYVINPLVSYDFIEMTSQLEESMVHADCLCFGTLSQRSKKTRLTLQKLVDLATSSLFFLDINLRKNCYSAEIIKYSLQVANVLKLNEDEVLELTEMFSLKSNGLPEFCEFMINEWNLDCCLVTLAARGVYAHAVSVQPVYIPGYKIDLVDPVGAGDAFSAGFIHKLLAGESIEKACSFGNLIGAMVATQHGATQATSIRLIEEFRNMRHDRNIDSRFNKYLNL